jgi:O-antigen ligase
MLFTFTGNPFASPGPMVPVVMFGWIPTVLYLFSRFPARKAVVISFVAGWLFLPVVQWTIPGIPDYTKTSATCYGILLATFIFDVGRFRSFRLSWLDLPMLIWGLCPIASSLSNDLGLYDGVAGALEKTMTWGVPYFLGRIYLNNLAALRQLAMGVFVGGLVYVPLCLFEVRFSPQLHRIVYGGHAVADFAQTIRLGGYRPTVFMQHGLAVGAFMMAATLIGIWFWRTGVVKRIGNVPIQVLVAILFVTFLLLRSSGALSLLVVGIALLWVSVVLRTALPVVILVAGIGVYLYLNAGTEAYITDQLVTYMSQIFPADRIESVVYRFNNEELLADKARQKIMFGWGGYGRSLVILDEQGNFTVQDSLWIGVFGENGAFGLISLFTAMLLPTIALFWSRCPARLWTRAQMAPAAVIGVTIVLYMVDCILNAMINPIYILACGGIAGIVLNPERKRQAEGNRALATNRYLAHQR